MRKSVPIIAFLASAVILVGCQGAKVPLGVASDSHVNQNLLGKWTSAGTSAGEGKTWLVVDRLDEHEYFIEIWEEDDKQDKINLRAFTTPVDGVLFASVRCIGCDEEDEYFFFKYERSVNGTLRIQGLNENLYGTVLNRFERSDALRAYVKRNLEEATFFDDEVMVFSQDG